MARILLSAYACEPHKGSEPGVGWHWAIELTRLGHEVWVLTRANNRLAIETEFAQQPQPANLHFLYYDLPAWARWWKKGNRGVHLYYLLWQWGAYCLAQKKHKIVKFERVHHVTFVSVHQPSFMGGLGIPFIFGPVAGGERAPWRLRFDFSFRGLLVDAIRDLFNASVKIDPLMLRTFKQAEKIYVTSEQTRQLVPKRFWDKTTVQLAIGIDGKERIKGVAAARKGKLRILYAGRFHYLKGMRIGFSAFQRLLAKVPEARLTLVGEGREERTWRRSIEKLGISGQVDWRPWLDKDDLQECYRQHDIFLFPSLRDSGGMVVLEAMSCGLPVVCLDLGGPGVLVNESCGCVIPTRGLSREQVVELLAITLIRLGQDKNLLGRLSYGALRHSQFYTWEKVVDRIVAT